MPKLTKKQLRAEFNSLEARVLVIEDYLWPGGLPPSPVGPGPNNPHTLEDRFDVIMDKIEQMEMTLATKKEVEEVWEELNNLKRATIRRSAAAASEAPGEDGRTAKRGGGITMG